MKALLKPYRVVLPSYPAEFHLPPRDGTGLGRPMPRGGRAGRLAIAHFSVATIVDWATLVVRERAAMARQAARNQSPMACRSASRAVSASWV